MIVSIELPPSLQDIFKYQQDIHDTRTSAQSCVKLPKTHTITFGIKSITGQAGPPSICHPKRTLDVLSRAVCKEELTDFIIRSY